MKLRKRIKRILKEHNIAHHYKVREGWGPGVAVVTARTTGADHEQEAAYMITERLVLAVDRIRQEPGNDDLTITVNSPDIGDYTPTLLITEDAT
jgi:hypothetical protein